MNKEIVSLTRQATDSIKMDIYKGLIFNFPFIN